MYCGKKAEDQTHSMICTQAFLNKPYGKKKRGKIMLTILDIRTSNV